MYWYNTGYKYTLYQTYSGDCLLPKEDIPPFFQEVYTMQEGKVDSSLSEDILTLLLYLLARRSGQLVVSATNFLEKG